MSNWIIAPVVLPALLAPVIAAVARHDIVLARTLSLAGTIFLTIIALGLTVVASQGGPYVYELGNWNAPFGIVLVLDRLSAMMMLLTTVLALIVQIYVIATDWDKRGRHFHALFQFQLMGLFGAFLTGDAFNLFVFFEILLIASYGLMIYGGGQMRLRAGLQYVVMNLAGSTLFLFALGTIYATTGTLNIADLAVKIREIPVDDAALIRVAAMLLMIVFAIKAALFPLQFWMPGTYANAPAPVAALFAIMTKVGAYAILRFYTVVFGPEVAATGSMPGDWLMPAALITVAIGAVGVLGAKRLLPLLSFAVLGSMGTLMLAVSVFTPQAISAALYYLVHSTLAAAAMFLVADLVISRRGAARDHLREQSPNTPNGLLAALFFAGAIAVAGMPPLSGFIGKLLVLDAVRASESAALIWAAILLGSLLTIIGFARAGSDLFWKTAEGAPSDNPDLEPDLTIPIPPLAVVGIMLALTALAALTVFAGPVTAFFEVTAAQLVDPIDYIQAVLPSYQKGS